jgi:DNA polymerase III epsilon subunit-like protein
LTGIDDDMVAGHVLDPAEVYRFAASAALIVAHHAAFDRRFAERLSDVFTTKPWACSMAEVPWADDGFDSAKLKLAYLQAEVYGCEIELPVQRLTAYDRYSERC